MMPKPSKEKGTTSKKTTSYVDAMSKQDHPAGKKTSKKTSAAKLAAMRSGKWLPPRTRPKITSPTILALSDPWVLFAVKVYSKKPLSRFRHF